MTAARKPRAPKKPTTPPRRPGRRPLITEDLVRAIGADVTAGHWAEHSAEANGIARSTLYKWLARGRAALELAEETGAEPAADDWLYVELVDTVTRGRGLARMKAVEYVRAAFGEEGGWRPALEYLKRQDAQIFADRSAVEVSGPDGGPIEQRVEHATDDRLAALVAAVAGAGLPGATPGTQTGETQ